MKLVVEQSALQKNELTMRRMPTRNENGLLNGAKLIPIFGLLLNDAVERDNTQLRVPIRLKKSRLYSRDNNIAALTHIVMSFLTAIFVDLITSWRWRMAVRTISKTFNGFAVRAIVANRISIQPYGLNARRTA